MNKTKKIFMKIIFSMQIIMFLLSPIGAQAHLDDEFEENTAQGMVGIKIRNYAIAFVNRANDIKSGVLTEYNSGYSEQSLETKSTEQLVLYCRDNRMTGYRYLTGKTENMITDGKFRPTSESGSWYAKGTYKLAFDCSSLVSTIYKLTCKINLDGASDTWWSTCASIRSHLESHGTYNGITYIDNLSGKSLNEMKNIVKAGDIIIYNTSHIMIFNKFVGDKAWVIDCGQGKGTNKTGIRIDKERDLSYMKQCVVARISESKAQEIINNPTNYPFDIEDLNWPGGVEMGLSLDYWDDQFDPGSRRNISVLL